MPQSVRPLGDRIVVKVLDRARVTNSGIHLPDTLRNESDRGTVVAVGPGAYVDGSVTIGQTTLSSPSTRPIPVDVGDVVLFSPYAGSTVRLGGEEFMLLREDDVLGVVEGEPDSLAGTLSYDEAAPAEA